MSVDVDVVVFVHGPLHHDWDKAVVIVVPCPVVEDGRGRVQDGPLHDNRDEAIIIVVPLRGCRPQARRARRDDGDPIPHVQRRTVLEDNFHRPPPPPRSGRGGNG